MPPKKGKLTYREMRQLKKEEMARRKLQKAIEKAEKDQLTAHGLCRGPRGDYGTNAEIGSRYGSEWWNNLSEEGADDF